MSRFNFRVIGLVLGKLFGFPGLIAIRVRSRPCRPRSGRVWALLLMMGILIAGPSVEAMAAVTGMTPPNSTIADPSAQPNTTLDRVAVSQSTQNTFAYPDADLNTTNLAGPIPTEPLYSDSLLTDAKLANTTIDGLGPAVGGLSNDLFSDSYVDLFVLGDLFLDSEDSLQLQLSASGGFFADSFLTSIPEPTGAAILGCSMLGLLANTRMGRSRSSSI